MKQAIGIHEVSVMGEMRLLCPACEEAFAVDNYPFCADCIRINDVLESRRLERRIFAEMPGRMDAGFYPFDAPQPAHGLPLSIAVLLGGSVGVTAAVLAFGLWEIARLAIDLMLKYSR